MTPPIHSRARFAALGALLAALAACTDTSAPAASRVSPAPKVQREILDGAHGGNRAVFFLPPMVANPQGQPGYGDPVLPNAPVTFKIECVDCTTPWSRTLAPTFVTDHYEANWDTKADNLDPAKTYRIETIVGSQIEAFADVDVVSSGSQLKTVSNEYIPLLDGRTLPIKARVEQGVIYCTGVCTSTVVTNTPPAGQQFTIVKTSDNETGVGFSANWFNPSVVGADAVIITLQNLTPAGGAPVDCSFGLTRMTTPNTPCLRITADPVVQNVTNEVRVTLCAVDRSDETQLLFKYDVGETPAFLYDTPSLFTCAEDVPRIGASTSSNPMLALAGTALQRVGRALSSVFGVREAYAIDLGVGGGFVDGGLSVVSAGRPQAMSILSGDGQTGVAGSPLALRPRVQVTNLHRGNPQAPLPFGPANAVVTCTVTSGGGNVNGATSGLATYVAQVEGNPYYECPAWTVGLGANTLHVTAANIDDQVFLKSDLNSPHTGSVTFNATGTSVPLGFLSVASPTGAPFDNTTLVIDGSNVNYVATINNPSVALSNVVLQGTMVQGNTSRAANGTLLSCDATSPLGTLPSGSCVQNWNTAANDVNAAGSGTFIAGPATLILQLLQSGNSKPLATATIPVNLVFPPIGN